MKTSSHLSSISSSALISSIVTVYALILLYLPYQVLLKIVFSPVLTITGILVLFLLRLGAIQRHKDENKEEEKPLQEEREAEAGENTEIEVDTERKEYNSAEPESISGLVDYDHDWVSYQSDTDSGPETDFNRNPCFEDSFVRWNLRAPLGVIYEEYEGEDDDDPIEKDPNPNHKEENRVLGIERYPSLSRYYPDSDSNSSSDGEFTAEGFWNSPDKMCFGWEEEDRERLIEIALDGNKRSLVDIHVEEENLIEIDISTRNDEFPTRNGVPPAS